MATGTDKNSIQNQDTVGPVEAGRSGGVCAMALSIQPIPAASGEYRSLSEFSQSLEKLGSHLERSGVGVRPAESAAFDTQQVRAAEVSKNVRSANDAVTEARGADDGLKQLGILLDQARSFAFMAINEPGRRSSQEDQAEFSRVLERLNEIAGSIQFGGRALLEGSTSFGKEGDLAKLDLSSFAASIGAIQVIDRAISEVSDQRGLLGIFQTSKLSEVGRLLRGGVGGVVSSESVVRDRVVAIGLAQDLVGRLGQEKESSLLGSGNAAGQILASIVGRL